MANSKIGRDLWLTDAQVKSEAKAKLEVVQGLAGRAHILHELATGQVVGGSPVTPPNPQGMVGCDMSGPPWGSAHLHTIASMGGMLPASGSFTSRPSSYFPLTDITSERLYGIDWKIWVRPFDPLPSPGIAPFSRAYLLMSGYNSSAVARNLAIYGFSNYERFDDAVSIAVATNATATDDAYTVGQGFYVRLRPGHNVVKLRFRTDTTSGTFTITKLMLYHGVKRSH